MMNEGVTVRPCNLGRNRLYAAQRKMIHCETAFVKTVLMSALQYRYLTETDFSGTWFRPGRVNEFP